MYRIIGADGREYGPVSAEQLRQWITEGRANGETKIHAEGSSDWTKLSELPEFFPKVTPPPQPGSAPAPFPTAPVRRNNSLAVTGLVLGALSVTLGCCCYGLPFNIGGIICSSLALGQIKDEPEKGRGRELAIAGLVLSILSLLLGMAMLVFGTTFNHNRVWWRFGRW